MFINQHTTCRSDITFNHAHLMLCYDCDPVPAAETNKFRNHLLTVLGRYLRDEDFDIELRGKHSITLISIKIVAYEQLDILIEVLRLMLASAMSDWIEAMAH